MATSLRKWLTFSAVITLTGCASQGSLLLPEPELSNDYSNMYLIGSFNWWEATETFKLTAKSEYIYSTTVELIADGQPYDFKVSDPRWLDNTNCGRFLSEQIVEVNDEVTLYCAADSGTIKFTPQKTANYTFTLDVSRNKSPRFIITKNTS